MSDTDKSCRFTPILEHPRGTFFSLVSTSYAPLWSDPEAICQWQRADQQTFDNPTTIAPCVAVTCIDDQPVGLIAFDPRSFPVAIIGQNCLLPKYRGKGIGRQQLVHILELLHARGFCKSLVTTSDHPFFVPAQRMYMSCGFREIARRPPNDKGPFGGIGEIDYALDWV